MNRDVRVRRQDRALTPELVTAEWQALVVHVDQAELPLKAYAAVVLGKTGYSGMRSSKGWGEDCMLRLLQLAAQAHAQGRGEPVERAEHYLAGLMKVLGLEFKEET